MLKELEWFHSKAQSTAVQPRGTRRCSLNVGEQHFERQCEATATHEGLVEMQDIFRILKLHSIAVNILDAVAKETVSAAKMNGPLYDFLQIFCTKSPKNQVALYATGCLALFVRQLPEHLVCCPVRSTVRPGSSVVVLPNPEAVFARGVGHPHPPPPSPKGAVTRVVCPLAPPVNLDSSTATG